MDKFEKIQICKLAALAIMSDSQLTDEELGFLSKLMDAYLLSETERREVRNRNFDDDVAAIAGEIDSEIGRENLLKELCEIVMTDGDLAPRERSLLSKVAVAVELTEADVDVALAKVAKPS